MKIFKIFILVWLLVTIVVTPNKSKAYAHVTFTDNCTEVYIVAEANKQNVHMSVLTADGSTWLYDNEFPNANTEFSIFVYIGDNGNKFQQSIWVIIYNPPLTAQSKIFDGIVTCSG